ncbi:MULTISPECIES: restriction endonuclease subunit S [Cysteiniphilum]|uniref:restriction endonuclease subunit S n=1 Tax=Cysteiniphilum TaxID=2056696 RepID=UPI00178652B9|nr:MULTISPECIES: restriction endonuclease subunit S [Cysteiniphilum]
MSFNTNDILYGKLRPNLNKVCLVDFDGICSTDILVFRIKKDSALSIYYKYYFLSNMFNDKVLQTVSGQQLPRTSWGKIATIKIPLPPLDKQKEIVAFCEKQEEKIKQAQSIIDNAQERKNEILKKHL